MATKARTGSTQKATTAELSEQISVIQSDLANLTKTIANLGQSKGEELSGAAKAQISHARDVAGAQVDAAKHQAERVQDQATEFVREQPAAAVGIALGVGVLIGILGARR